MSCSARASRPISSRRAGRIGTSTSRARPSRTRCAAWASRRSGLAMVRARKRDSRTETIRVAARISSSEPRSARTTRRTSRALTVSSSTSPPPVDPLRRRRYRACRPAPAAASVVGRAAAQRRRASGQAASTSRAGGTNRAAGARADDRVEAVVEPARDARDTRARSAGSRSVVGRRRAAPAVRRSRAVAGRRRAAACPNPGRAGPGSAAARSGGTRGEHVRDHHRFGLRLVDAGPGSAGCGSCRDRRSLPARIASAKMLTARMRWRSDSRRDQSRPSSLLLIPRQSGIRRRRASRSRRTRRRRRGTCGASA